MDNRIRRWGMIGCGVAGAYLLLKALLLEKYFFEVNFFEIGKQSNSQQKVRLLLLTDLHFRKWFWPFHKKLARKVNKLKPDIILISGDIIDETSSTAAAANQFFCSLDYNIPKAVILGNHDLKNKVSIDSYNDLFRRSNCTYLNNKSHVFLIKGARIMVTGLEDFIEGNPSVATAFKEVGTEINHVLLVHSPLQQEASLKEIEHINASRPIGEKIILQYIFAGHNHGGQVTIFGLAPILPKKAGNYLKGWYNDQRPYLYVSKGFGTSTLPFRFGARAEVTVFEMGI